MAARNFEIESGCSMQPSQVVPSWRRWAKLTSGVAVLAMVLALCFLGRNPVQLVSMKPSQTISHQNHAGTDQYELISDAPELAEAANHSAQFASLVEAASWAFSKAMGAYSIYTQWGAIKLSLKEAELASQEALEAVNILGEKLANVSIMFVTSGVKELATKLQNGLLDMDLLTDVCNRTTSDGSFEVTHMMELFRSGTIEVERIAKTSDSVIDLVANIQNLTQQVSELTEAWVHVNMSWFEPLKEKVVSAKEQLHELNFAIERQFHEVHTLVQDYEQGLWNQTNATLEHIRNQTNAAFGELGLEIDAFDTMFTLVIKPLVSAMVQGTRTLVENAEQYLLPAEAPDNAAEETISRWSCAWRNTRWFDAIDDVDIQRTMSCQPTILNQFKCSCIGRYDCYATSDYRPDPKETKRCFQHSWR